MTETIMALLIAIRCVESTDGLDVRANGNNYQITKVCVEDVNRIYHTKYKWPDDVKKDEDAQNIAFLYLSYYADRYRRDYGRVPSKAVLARIYNRGYQGMKRGEGHGYAVKVMNADHRKQRGRMAPNRALKGATK